MLIVGCLSDLDKNEAHYRGKVQNINWQQLFSVRILRHKMRAILRKMLTHRYCLPVYFMPARKLLACRMLTLALHINEAHRLAHFECQTESSQSLYLYLYLYTYFTMYMRYITMYHQGQPKINFVLLKQSVKLYPIHSFCIRILNPPVDILILLLLWSHLVGGIRSWCRDKERLGTMPVKLVVKLVIGFLVRGYGV